jgi:hypothetical protein
MVDLLEWSMDEEQYGQVVKAILREMGSPFLITLYVGADVPQNVFEEIFQKELENELTDRGARGSGDEEPKGYWPLHDLDDDEVHELGDFFEVILPNYLQRWQEGIEAVKAYREKNEVPR